MSIPADQRYSETHQGARSDSNGAVSVGITHHTQDFLGDLVLVEGPAMGLKLKKAEQRGMVESVKTASDIYALISGAISAVNGDLENAPEKINQNVYEAWIFKLKPADKSELMSVLDAEDYQELIEAEAR